MSPHLAHHHRDGHRAAPTFSYHRFWAEADIATAFDTFAQLFPMVNPGS